MWEVSFPTTAQRRSSAWEVGTPTKVPVEKIELSERAGAGGGVTLGQPLL